MITLKYWELLLLIIIPMILLLMMPLMLDFKEYTRIAVFKEQLEIEKLIKERENENTSN